MPQISKNIMSPKVEKKIYDIFINSVSSVKSENEVVDFLNDLLSHTEKVMLAKRVSIAFLLLEGKLRYRDISKILKVSLGTIARVNGVLALQRRGYKKILGEALKKKALKILLSELIDVITIVPPKGANWSEWHIEKRRRRLERREPL
ncbi:hypothetical protein A2955_04635 [Candidatus Woesebacteria bacterium RIFCSPLOWO2_01_FULL_37_19]|uniref:TrpR like protein, YerC/YecD n=2 Tax=Candidatus Woeseibacteriota TaxID=1752722 RepID=A0A1F8BAK8_9BACT|nr:MAG: hypothetical protein A2771_01595 [Candidatus Woesebacteria bacterium RIFCSPHIGHO2_01_FULL_38_26b]OGM61082.1 MAG: hypothetical protein A2955_04635 [Candidatus Woesebacteria bacterium RIFCSPLOWO2_01_FULL_37_19]